MVNYKVHEMTKVKRNVLTRSTENRINRSNDCKNAKKERLTRGIYNASTAIISKYYKLIRFNTSE